MSVLRTGIPILLITANSQVTQVLESFPLGACPGHWSNARPPMSTYAELSKPNPGLNCAQHFGLTSNPEDLFEQISARMQRDFNSFSKPLWTV